MEKHTILILWFSYGGICFFLFNNEIVVEGSTPEINAVNNRLPYFYDDNIV